MTYIILTVKHRVLLSFTEFHWIYLERVKGRLLWNGCRLRMGRRVDSRVTTHATQLLDHWGRAGTFPEMKCQLSCGLQGLSVGWAWMEGHCEVARYGGDCIQGRCFYTEGAAAMISLRNHLELLLSAPFSHKNGCNLRQLRSWQAIFARIRGQFDIF